MGSQGDERLTLRLSGSLTGDCEGKALGCQYLVNLYFARLLAFRNSFHYSTVMYSTTTEKQTMESTKLLTILGGIYLAILIVMLQFGQITGYSGQHEGRVIDVVIKGIAQLL